MPLADDQAVIVIEFFAAPDVAQCINEDSPVFLSGFAIRRAAMIDPARIIAVGGAVYHPAVFQAKEKRMKRIFRIGAGTLFSLSGGNAFTFVFDYAGAGGDFAGGEYAVAVNGGMSDNDCGRSVIKKKFCGSGAIHFLSVGSPATSWRALLRRGSAKIQIHSVKNKSIVAQMQ